MKELCFLMFFFCVFDGERLLFFSLSPGLLSFWGVRRIFFPLQQLSIKEEPKDIKQSIKACYKHQKKSSKRFLGN